MKRNHAFVDVAVIEREEHSSPFSEFRDVVEAMLDIVEADTEQIAIGYQFIVFFARFLLKKGKVIIQEVRRGKEACGDLISIEVNNVATDNSSLQEIGFFACLPFSE